jgi:phage gp29-like protein
VLDDETRAKEIILAKQEVDNLDTQIKLEQEKIDTYSAKLKPGARDTTGKTTTENTTAPPQEVIQDTIKALNANPSKALLDHVKAKFKEAYPDLEFEKYIKVNPAKYK